MNSDMSIRTIASSVSKRNSASALQSSVLPTPVGPRNRNEPFGRRGSARPARERRIAFETMRTASSWPTTRFASASSIRSSFSFSPSSILETGMPVHLETTSAISSSVTVFRTRLVVALPSAACASPSRFSSSGILPYCSSAMRARSPLRRAASSSSLSFSRSSLMVDAPWSEAFSLFQTSSRSAYSFSSAPSVSSSAARRFFVASSFSFFSATCSIFSWMMRRSSLSSSSGFESISMRMRAAASSIRSIALSGSCRSVM